MVDDLLEIIPMIWGRSIHSIFIGGGTPSLMPPHLLKGLFSELRQYLTFTSQCEITLEANPGTVDSSYFEGYREAGVNRLSIGVQSLDNERLKKIGRIHDAAEAIEAVSIAKSVGFEEINCDLMFGLPDQSLEEAISDLEGVLALEPTHLSHYQLTLEPNTYFYRYQPNLPDEELIEQMQIESYARLAEAGFHHYEISAFAKRGSESRHNSNYWSFGDYVGIGAGAHGKITMMNERKIYRTQIEKHPRTYIEKSGGERLTKRMIEAEDLPFEFLMNVLRLKEGVPQAYWQQRTFLENEQLFPKLEQLEERGLIDLSEQRIRSSDSGFLFLNQILSEFI